jgi:hypothetical protein
MEQIADGIATGKSNDKFQAELMVAKKKNKRGNRKNDGL